MRVDSRWRRRKESRSWGKKDLGALERGGWKQRNAESRPPTGVMDPVAPLLTRPPRPTRITSPPLSVACY